MMNISAILCIVLDTFIYRISPEEPQTLLATPNWPQGMKPSSTVSWIVTLPSHYEADLRFLNVSQPKCDNSHTAIKVMLLGREDEIMSRREDQPKDYDLLVPESFYLNMSNCIPQEGQFKAVTKIVLRKKSSKRLNERSVWHNLLRPAYCELLKGLNARPHVFPCRLVAHHSGGSGSVSAFACPTGCCLRPEKVSRLVAAEAIYTSAGVHPQSCVTLKAPGAPRRKE